MRDSAPAHLRNVLPDSSADGHLDEDVRLPSMGDGDYRPYARPAYKPLYAIHLITPQGDVHSFQYVHLDSNSGYTSGRIVLRFMGAKLLNVLIEGRNLWELYDYIHQHRMAWVRVAARDFAGDKEAIVTKISVFEAGELASL